MKKSISGASVFRLLFSLLVAAFFFAGCSNPSGSGDEDPAAEDPIIEDPVDEKRETIFDFAYGDDPLQKMDVWFPAVQDETRGAVLLIHGGSWTGGDKLIFPSLIMQTFANIGYVTVSINYRLFDPEAPAGESAGFPEMLADVHAARLAMAEKAAEWGFDPQKIAVVGLSAGAHLGLLETLQNSDSSIVACASLSGPTDLMDPAFLNYVVAPADAEAGTPAVTVGDGLGLILGGAYDPEDEDSQPAWKLPSPLWRLKNLYDASPEAITRVQWFLAWGALDEFVPYVTQGKAFYEELNDIEGVSATHYEGPEDGHGLETSFSTILTGHLKPLFDATLK